MKRITVLTILALTVSCFIATAQKQKNKKMKKVLFVVTSHDKLGNTGEKTGFWTEELAAPYYELLDQGIEITIATPLGGQPPIDPKSADPASATEDTKRFDSDTVLLEKLKHTKKLSDVNQADYDAVFYPGGHGPLWDLAENEISARIILDYYNAGKPVGAVCHGPAALIRAAELQPGFLTGKRVAGFTNAEETLTARSGNIPYELETRLKELGADFHSALLPFASHVEVDGLLVTGQNPLSAGPTAKALIDVLEGQYA